MVPLCREAREWLPVSLHQRGPGNLEALQPLSTDYEWAEYARKESPCLQGAWQVCQYRVNERNMRANSPLVSRDRYVNSVLTSVIRAQRVSLSPGSLTGMLVSCKRAYYARKESPCLQGAWQVCQYCVNERNTRAKSPLVSRELDRYVTIV
jgi:hypothetical protein